MICFKGEMQRRRKNDATGRRKGRERKGVSEEKSDNDLSKMERSGKD